MAVIEYVQWLLFIWYIVVTLLGLVGYCQIIRKFLFRVNYLKGTLVQKHLKQFVEDEPKNTDLPYVSILRPIKGLDPGLEACLESSFHQVYPVKKYEIIFCVASRSDPALLLARQLMAKYPNHDCRIMVDETESRFGLNPKINNLMKGYINAKHDLLWVWDSNVWAGKLTMLKSATTFSGKGYERGRKIKVVHHVPLAVATSPGSRILDLGSKLDEMFMTTAHAKYYMGLNTVNTAPCVNGKSNFYRRSELDESVRALKLEEKLKGVKSGSNASPYGEAYTAASSSVANSGNSSPLRGASTATLIEESSPKSNPVSARDHPGLGYFAQYIGEDNMIAIALWNYPRSKPGYSKLIHEAVYQPVNHANFYTSHDTDTSGWMESLSTVKNYVNRRTRWLRVRKYMVLAATLLEPSTECLLAGAMGSYAISRLFYNAHNQTTILALHVLTWFLIDVSQWHTLRRAYKFYYADQHDPTLPSFLPGMTSTDKSVWFSASRWVLVWVIRECLALPIWIIAMVGEDVNWRGEAFVITKDDGAKRTHLQ
ncbi:glycosyltransferase family 21 protein [Babjeviella inositovora NRRL Y-12698]|uniref:Ceramide glucosyltransferase n=1 Tax=Babjeviella inositovora NRRL Y-12698 TaxID=984486 RepID=A0A1E3QMN3_9ASCO|nr:glycosyltransferase family 21 protein [Babjeviella inositovora NRRL Y-12698]ODQ78949.1 glycosyltransferase family 21 protein [Babjeviella inositovora NRRL Y-12698]